MLHWKKWVKNSSLSADKCWHKNCLTHQSDSCSCSCRYIARWCPVSEGWCPRQCQKPCRCRRAFPICPVDSERKLTTPVCFDCRKWRTPPPPHGFSPDFSLSLQFSTLFHLDSKTFFNNSIFQPTNKMWVISANCLVYGFRTSKLKLGASSLLWRNHFWPFETNKPSPNGHRTKASEWVRGTEEISSTKA